MSNYRKPNLETLTLCSKKIQIIIDQLTSMQKILQPTKSAKGGQEESSCAVRVTNNSESEESLSILHSSPADRGYQRMITVQTYPDGSKSKMYVLKKDDKIEPSKENCGCEANMIASAPKKNSSKSCEKDNQSSSESSMKSDEQACPLIDEPQPCPLRKPNNEANGAQGCPYRRPNYDEPKDQPHQFRKPNKAKKTCDVPPACPYIKKEKIDDESESCPNKKSQKEPLEDDAEKPCPYIKQEKTNNNKQCRFSENNNVSDAKNDDLSDPFSALQMMLVPRAQSNENWANEDEDEIVPEMDVVAQRLFNEVMDKVMQSILNMINILKTDPMQEFGNQCIKDDESFRKLQTDLVSYNERMQQSMRGGLEQLYLSLTKPTNDYAPELKRIFEIQKTINKFLASNLTAPACMAPPKGL